VSIGHDGGVPKVNRKGFLDWALGTTVGGFVATVLYPVARYVFPPEVSESAVASVVVPFGPDDLPPNAGRIFKFGSKAAILVRTPGGELRAFSARCTHLDCTVQFREEQSDIWCACHNGVYDLRGNNIAGPPPEPLPAYDVNVRGSQIVVSLRT